MHNHTPSKYQNTVLQFLEFLFSPIKLFRYYIDGADVCFQCNTPIAVPLFYNSSVSNIIYFLGGILISFAGVYIPTPAKPIIYFLPILFHHIYTAIVFSCALWLPYESSQERTKTCKQEAWKGLLLKVIAFSIGVHTVLRFY